jgi:hypothetical protein
LTSASNQQVISVRLVEKAELIVWNQKICRNGRYQWKEKPQTDLICNPKCNFIDFIEARKVYNLLFADGIKILRFTLFHNSQLLSNRSLSRLSDDRTNNKAEKYDKQDKEVQIEIFNEELFESQRVHFFCHCTYEYVICEVK